MFAPKRMSGLIFQLVLGLGALRLTFGADGIRTNMEENLKFGPPAREKIMSMFGSDSNTSTSWPSGKAVKITFRKMDDAKVTKHLKWKPDRENLHEVMLERAGLVGIQDFEVYYEDEDGDKLQVDATHSGIEAFLADHNDHLSPKLQVEWRFPTTLEMLQSKVQSAKAWLIGDGGATDQAVQDAQQKVEGNGGKIAANSGSGRSFVEHKGYNKTEWPEVVQGLTAELGLSESEKQALLNAARRKDGKARHFRQQTSGNKITAQHFAYHTVCHDNEIDLVYGKHEESMEVSGAATALPGENSIQYNGTTFAAWPPASPHSNIAGSDMQGLVVEIPSGWQLVDSAQEDFDNIRQRVIAPYGWHTGLLVTSGPDGQLQGYVTGRHGSDAGNNWWGLNSGHVEKKDESRFHFKATSLRLLIQAKPAANHELINDWKRFVQLSAQREWSQQLGAPTAGSIQE